MFGLPIVNRDNQLNGSNGFSSNCVQETYSTRVTKFTEKYAEISIRESFTYTLGWVNLLKKFEIEKYTVCGKLIPPKKWKGI